MKTAVALQPGQQPHSGTAEVTSKGSEGGKAGDSASEAAKSSPAGDGQKPASGEAQKPAPGETQKPASASSPGAKEASAKSAKSASEEPGIADMMSPRGTPAYQELQVDIAKLQGAVRQLEDNLSSEVPKIASCMQEQDVKDLISKQFSQLKEEMKTQVSQLEQSLQKVAADVAGGSGSTATSQDTSGGGAVAAAASVDAARIEAMDKRFDELAASLARLQESSESVAPVQEVASAPPDMGAEQKVLVEQVNNLESRLHTIFAAFGVGPESLEAGSLVALVSGSGTPALAHGASSQDIADVEIRVTGRITELEARVTALEELDKPTPGSKGGYGGPLADAYERVSQIVDASSPNQAATNVAAAALGQPGGATAAGHDASALSSELQGVRSELEELRRKYEELASRLAANEAEAASAAAGGGPADAAAERSEMSAKEAKDAAATAEKFKMQLDEALQTMEEARLRAQNDTLDGLQACADQQKEMEAKLAKLKEQLESDNPDLTETLGAVVQDIRYCLKRCELLFQLPEIKQYIKRFQASLQVNAVLQDRWLGPSARSKGAFDDLGEDGADETALGAKPDHVKSTGDLTTHTRLDLVHKAKKGESKKRPFRTVTDWARPHTPLSIDPQPPRDSPTLPQIP
eukprot:TRINITY_DN23641_c0_g1_i1.p1 TRINITY_DN23641_c0_g1~~TRINITY_DN23641_c0_g1_i1.p1  ORF type:complete len:721 (+),score=193.18 TRINITY_DN23641_c0_g1_i1:250-2163(+)